MTGAAGEYEHALRAWTTADEYQRVLRAWAETNLPERDVEKVFEVGIRYSTEACRECTVEDASLDVKVVYEDSSGRRCTTWIYDNAKVIRSMAAMLTETQLGH